jgi:hypothetical protein
MMGKNNFFFGMKMHVRTYLHHLLLYIITCQGCLNHFLGVEVAVGVASTPTPNTNSNTPILGVTPNLGVFYIL